MIDRIVHTAVEPEDAQEQELEITLRPQDFENYIGQERIKKNLQLSIAASKKGVNHLIIFCYMAHQVLVRQLWQVLLRTKWAHKFALPVARL